MKYTSLTAAFLGLTLATPSFANICDEKGGENIAEVTTFYDAAIEQYKTLQNSGAVSVRFDPDGDGPQGEQIFDVDQIINAYQSIKDKNIEAVEKDISACKAALDKMESQENIAVANLVLSPGSMLFSAVIDKGLGDLGLGQNNDLRGAITTSLNPIKPMLEIINYPKKTIKMIWHKPHRIIQPWKW
jgi:hypothetical protein